MKKLFIIVLVLFNLTTVYVSAQSVAGQNTVSSMGINPSILEVVLDKNNATTQVITLSNLTNLPIPIKVTKQSFTPKEKLSIPEDELHIYDASSWITIDNTDTDFILQPQEIKNIEITINQPENASPGGHYATIIFEPLIPEGLISQNSVYIYARVAALMFMQVRGEIIEDVSLEGISTNLINEPGLVNFNLNLKNNGNSHIRPKSQIVINNVLTHEEVLKANFQEGIVLPGTVRTFQSQFESNTLFGIYSYKTTINYGADNLVLETPTQYFFVFPYKLAFLLIFIILFLIYIKTFRRRISKAVKVLFKEDRASKMEHQKFYKNSPYFSHKTLDKSSENRQNSKL